VAAGPKHCSHQVCRHEVYTFGAQIVEVDIDEITGKVEVLQVWSAHDVGRAINPGAVERQIQGGVVQGLG
jgi:CO/xanthine dehydrogenase Mo-binding subunit